MRYFKVILERRKKTVHKKRSTNKTQDVPETCDIILAILSADSRTFVCRDTRSENKLQFFTTGGPTVVIQTKANELCDLYREYMGYMGYMDLDIRKAYSSDCSLVTVMDQKAGDCVVWGLQFANCLSTDQDLTALQTSVAVNTSKHCDTSCCVKSCGAKPSHGHHLRA